MLPSDRLDRRRSAIRSTPHSASAGPIRAWCLGRRPPLFRRKFKRRFPRLTLSHGKKAALTQDPPWRTRRQTPPPPPNASAKADRTNHRPHGISAIKTICPPAATFFTLEHFILTRPLKEPGNRKDNVVLRLWTTRARAKNNKSSSPASAWFYPA